MMFRKTLIATTAVAAIMSAAPSAFADVVANHDFGGGTITFRGSVTEAPCSIVPGDDKLDINLGQVSQKMLSAADKGSTPVDVVIHLNSCQFDVDTPPANGGTANPHGALSKVDVEFANYTSSSVSTGLLHNDGTAAHVDVQLLDNAGQPIPLDRVASDATAHQLTGPTGEMTFKARMLASGAATAGSVSARVDYKLKYF
ncbi:fimbrial protein StdA [Salmonella enterica subsp. enterica serovar Enteritidis]|nr:fimbrial protein StdA [Salmonella enterica subsp. enterica serovar Enteritidis]